MQRRVAKPFLQKTLIIPGFNLNNIGLYFWITLTLYNLDLT